MTQQVPYILVVAAMLLLAGCASSTPGTPATPTTERATSSTDAAAPRLADTGTVAFYISDEENAIGDFAHLNVTVTSVGFERAAGNGSDGGWVERDVANVTVDLTELQGERATLVDAYELPNGTYQKVFVHVSEVNGALESGENVRVKLPSEKLQLQKGFTVGSGEEVAFVFDITVHRAGNSGKYILTPVVGESGTDVPIESTDGDRTPDDQNGDDAGARSLQATFAGTVSPGENATLVVTRNGSPVENASVALDGTVVGTTDASGELTVAVLDAEALTVTVTVGDDEVELEREFAEDTATTTEA